MRTYITLFLILAGVAALSCQQSKTSTMMPTFIEPQVVSLSPDGKQAKVNIGVTEHIRPGETLYVVRNNNRLVGILSVMQPSAYTSDCMIRASESMTKMPPGSAVTFGQIAVGDHVVRTWPSVTPPELSHDRVVDKVSVTLPSDNASLPGKTILIPREQYDQWVKDHPPKSTVPTMGPSK